MKTAGILKSSTGAGFNLLKWAWKNKYIIIIIFSLLPVLLSSIQISRETNNGYYIPISIGLSVVNSDAVLYEQVYFLENDPQKIIGMEKPSEGIFQKTKYFFKLARVVWGIIGLISLITLPFIFFKWIWRKSDTSTEIKAFILGLITFLIFILIVNLIVIVVNISSGSLIYQLDKSLDFFGQAKQVISLIFPFHGIVALFKFLFGMAI